jgi:replicative DNA helicase
MARPQHRAQPHSQEAERAVLGGLLLEPQRLAEVRTRLEPRDWYLESHRILYQAFLDLVDAGSTPDTLTLHAHLDQAGGLAAIGGVAFLASLDLDLPDLSRLNEYADIVRDRSVRRDLIGVAQKTIHEATATTRPVTEVIADLRDGLDKLLGRASRVRWESAGATLDRLLVAIENGSHAAGLNLQGFTSGYPDWDRLGPGFLQGGLYVLAGRPGMGKTSLALDLTRHVAVDLHKPVGVFSLEMRADELGLKLGSAEANIATRYLRGGANISTGQWRDLYAATRRLNAAHLYLDDTPGLVLRDLEARAWWLKAQYPDLALLVVDYLQLITAGIRVEQRRLEIAHITRRLKNLAGELGVAVIVLSQLNRDVTKRSDPRPQLADLAESGAIEQDADQVAFIHRPELYTPEDLTVRGLAEIIIAKHRQGETGSVSLTWRGATTSFHNPITPRAAGGPDPF